jgi:hypothetical protein
LGGFQLVIEVQLLEQIAGPLRQIGVRVKLNQLASELPLLRQHQVLQPLHELLSLDLFVQNVLLDFVGILRQAPRRSERRNADKDRRDEAGADKLRECLGHGC